MQVQRLFSSPDLTPPDSFLLFELMRRSVRVRDEMPDGQRDRRVAVDDGAHRERQTGFFDRHDAKVGSGQRVLRSLARQQAHMVASAYQGEPGEG